MGMLFLEFDDGVPLPGETDLDEYYWWTLDHAGFAVLDFCRFACGRTLDDFAVDVNAPDAARAALELLPYLDAETQEEERDGLFEKSQAAIPWFDPAEAAVLARRFAAFLRERPDPTDEAPFADFEQWEVEGYRAAREDVIRVHEQVAAVFDGAAARGARFHFFVPKGRAEELFRASNERTLAWWRALRGS